MRETKLTLESKLRALVAECRERKIGLNESMKLTPSDLLNQFADRIEALLAERQPRERIVSREEFNNSIADEAAQSCVDWSNPERRKEALRYIVKQIWNEALAERQEPPSQKSQREASNAAEKADCEKALLTLAGWYPTPVEGYGFNTSWAISDLCRAIYQLRAAEPSSGTGETK